MKRWVWINVALKVLDLGTTYYFVRLHGLEVERNPLMRAAYGYLGLDFGSAMILAVFGLLMWLLCRSGSKTTLMIIAGLMALVVCNNFWHILIGS